MTDTMTSQNIELFPWDTLYNKVYYQVHTGKTEEIFGHKRDEKTEDRRKLHTEKVRDLYFSPKVIRGIKYSGMGRVCDKDRGRGDMRTGF
jgi:CRISPR/Cas system type I-B associated protein Csh2 (Cas7 group RAMP superfamily)